MLRVSQFFVNSTDDSLTQLVGLHYWMFINCLKMNYKMYDFVKRRMINALEMTHWFEITGS